MPKDVTHASEGNVRRLILRSLHQLQKVLLAKASDDVETMLCLIDCYADVLLYGGFPKARWLTFEIWRALPSIPTQCCKVTSLMAIRATQFK